MKAITLHQPWAWLIAEGLKRYETRSWPTRYRGPLAIHAGKRPVRVRELHHYIVDVLEERSHTDLSPLPFGAVICIVDLVDCIPTDKLQRGMGSLQWAFGNFAPGRFAWKLENVRKIEPVVINGARGLWEWKQP